MVWIPPLCYFLESQGTSTIDDKPTSLPEGRKSLDTTAFTYHQAGERPDHCQKKKTKKGWCRFSPKATATENPWTLKAETKSCAIPAQNYLQTIISSLSSPNEEQTETIRESPCLTCDWEVNGLSLSLQHLKCIKGSIFIYFNIFYPALSPYIRGLRVAYNTHNTKHISLKLNPNYNNKISTINTQ